MCPTLYLWADSLPSPNSPKGDTANPHGALIKRRPKACVQSTPVQDCSVLPFFWQVRHTSMRIPALVGGHGGPHIVTCFHQDNLQRASLCQNPSTAVKRFALPMAFHRKLSLRNPSKADAWQIRIILGGSSHRSWLGKPLGRRSLQSIPKRGQALATGITTLVSRRGQLTFQVDWPQKEHKLLVVGRSARSVCLSLSLSVSASVSVSLSLSL